MKKVDEKLKKFVTSYINNIHLSNNSTIGNNDLGKSLGSPLNPSINLSSAYAFKTISALNEYHDNKRDNTRYARDGNDLTRQTEEYFGHIFDNSTSFLFNSGMAAVSCALNVLYKKIDNIVTFGVFYRKTEALISEAADQYKIHYHNIIDDDLSLLRSLSGKTLFFVENFSNPFLRVSDVENLKKECPDSYVILDATLQGLIPSENEAKYVDITVSSCTKYIGGHNDFLAGVLSTKNRDLAREVWDFRSANGAILGPLEAYLLLRSLRTYDLRVAKIEQNTDQVISFLKEHPKVKKIFYPFSFSNDDQAAMATQYCFHGGLISFQVVSDVNLEKNIGNLCSTKMAPSFGSVDSLVEIPFYMSKRVRGDVNQGHYHSLRFSNKFVRFSVGCEPISFILNDLRILLSP